MPLHSEAVPCSSTLDLTLAQPCATFFLWHTTSQQKNYLHKEKRWQVVPMTRLITSARHRPLLQRFRWNNCVWRGRKKKRIQSAHSKSHRGDLRAEKFRPSPPGGTRVTNAWLKHKKIIFYFLGPWSGPKKRPIKCPIRRETRPTELSSVLATAQNDFSALCLTFRLIHFHPGRHFLFLCQSNFTFIQISTTKKNSVHLTAPASHYANEAGEIH